VPAQIGENQSIARSESICHRQPKFMIGGKWVQENHRGPFAQNVIDNFRVTAINAPHLSDLITDDAGVLRQTFLEPNRTDRSVDYALVACRTPAGAFNINGSSGMIIQAIG
jgi:hypothetical protein